LKLKNFKKVFQKSKIVQFKTHYKNRWNWNFTSCGITHSLGQKKNSLIQNVESSWTEGRDDLIWTEGRANPA